MDFSDPKYSIRTFMASQPFDKNLSAYKKSLYPKDKLLYDKNVGPYYNYILDWQTGKYEYLSEGIKELTGYDDEFISRGIEALWQVMHPNDMPAVQKMNGKSMALLFEKPPEEFNSYSANFNFRIKTSSGVYINLLQQPVYYTFDCYGNIVYGAGILMDITRYRNDGNISLVMMDPNGQKLFEYYPKEDFAPEIATVRSKFDELNRLCSRTDDIFLRNVLKVLSNHATNKEFNVDTLSNILNVSRSKLYRYVKESLSLMPGQLIRFFRLQQSLEYLSRGELQVSEVAYKVGFSSHAYFTQCFHQEFECTPTEYQKQVQ